MRQYSDKLLDFIQKEEGNVQSVRKLANSYKRRKNNDKAMSTLKRIHPRNTGDGLVWGAYYDDNGYLTAGSGTLISTKPSGSKEEMDDIRAFKAKYNIDPFTMNKDQARSLISIKLEENVNDYINTEHGVGIDYDSLPESAKIAVGSLAYNIGGTKLGQQGKNYSAQLKKAAKSKKAEDWRQFQKQQIEFHGTTNQPAGVIKRRSAEAKFIDDIVNESSIGEQFITPKAETPIIETLLKNLNPIPEADAAEEAVALTPNKIPAEDPNINREDDSFELPDQMRSLEPDEASLEDTMLEDTRFEQQQEQIKAVKAEEEQPLIEKVNKFGDHLLNSFVTENIVGSTLKKAILTFDADQEVDLNFQPTKLMEYKELTKDIPNEDLKEILESSYNASQFRNRTIGYNMERKAREEMSQYMSTNPISGFVGIGVASVVDVTSFIPVGRLARIAGMSKAAKGLPMVVRNVGAQISENVVQDLIQETILTNNSDIRKWDDGDILYGMVAGALVGGVAGKFKTDATINKFNKLAGRMVNEKNLDGINMMIRNAEKKGLGSKTVSELKQVRTVIENSLRKDHQLMVLTEVKKRQNDIAKGLKDTKKLEMVKARAEFIENTNKAIEARKIEVVDEKLRSLKVSKQEMSTVTFAKKTEINKQMKPLQAELTKLKKLPKSSSTDHKIKKIEKELTKLDTKLKKVLDESSFNAKKMRSEKAKIVRTADKLYAADAKIAELEMSKVKHLEDMNKSLDEFNSSVDSGKHPELASLTEPYKMNAIAESMGLPQVFNSVDELDSTLGLRFNDSLSSARVQVQPSEYVKAQDVNEMFNKTTPELWEVVNRQFQESRENPALGIASFNVNKDSMTAKIARATRMHQLLTTESTAGRFMLNKSALKWSNNEFASAFYNWAAPDGVGRLNGGKLSVIEAQQMLANSYGGAMRTSLNEANDKLQPLILKNKQLRSDLELPSNDLAARLMMMEAYFPEQLSKLLRDELISEGNARLKYGSEVGTIVETWKKDFNSLTARVLKDAKEAGVVGVEGLEQSDNWFHRSWDNRAAIQFDIMHGTEKFEELILNGMRDYMIEQGKEINPDILDIMKPQAKKFAYGLRSKDTRVFMDANINYQRFMQKLLDADIEGVDPDTLRKEIKRIEDNLTRSKERELAKRKPISMNSFVDLEDGSKFMIRDLLESNILASQTSYMNSMAGRIASARNGLKDVNLLDEWVDRSVELERRRGKLDHADYIEKSMREDVEAIKYGHSHREGNIDGSVTRLQRMAMKYNAARLMQYTGISSIAEMNALIAEAGYKAVGQVIVDNAVPLMKSYMFGGVTGKVFRDTMYDELSIATGIGFEDISFDALLSSSRTITASRVGQGFERVVDNAAKMTRRATSHIETTGRRLAVNSLAVNFGNIALGRDVVSNILGGLSNVNLVELGLADLVKGKAVKNKMWDNIMDSIRRHALDEDGNLASQSGKNIRQFNLAKWDLDTRRKFSEVLVQQANHIIVNPDSTTAKLWHNTWWGSMFNQFRTFANNAQSKVAGHNLNQAMQGYRMGEVAEFSKLAQKYFWGAALGKLSLVLYGAVNNAGREDFNERMEQYMGVDDFRDWTAALSRSSAITGFDSSVDTMIGLGNLSGHMKVDPLFDSSTIGQSRDRLSWQTTATGQLAVGTAAVGTGVLKGDFSAAGKQALKMSPFRRQLGVNQLLNAMGVD